MDTDSVGSSFGFDYIGQFHFPIASYGSNFNYVHFTLVKPLGTDQPIRHEPAELQYPQLPVLTFKEFDFSARVHSRQLQRFLNTSFGRSR